MHAQIVKEANNCTSYSLEALELLARVCNAPGGRFSNCWTFEIPFCSNVTTRSLVMHGIIHNDESLSYHKPYGIKDIC